MGKIVRTISEDGGIICCAIDSTDMVYRAEQIHTTSATVTAAIGRLMTAASIMGSMLKGEDNSVTLRIKADGPIGALIAVSDAKGNVKAYVENPVVEIPLNSYGKLDVSGAVGKDGMLYVIKDIGMKEPYIGQVPIVSGEIAEDITNYYATSEQTPSVCGLGVLVNPDLTVKSAGGFLVQLMPGVDDESIDKLENNINALEPVSKMLADGLTPENIAFKVLDGFAPQVLDTFNASYKCDCSKERVERALISIGRDELLKMADEQPETSVECHFCDKVYKFTADDLRKLAER